jgi:hypothetical protein
MGYVAFKHSRGYDFTLWKTFIDKDELDLWLKNTTIPRNQLLIYQDIDNKEENNE